MGTPAARALLDTAGHVGPITVGSPNVLIGGAPAARKGDLFICTDPTHGGSGIIVGGSKTVLINGVPAARMGDATDCAGVPTPPPAISGGAPDNIYTATLAKNTNEDGTIKTSRPDNVKAKAFYFETKQLDKTGDGTYDYVSAETAVVDMTVEGTYTTEGGYDVIGGGGELEYMKVETGTGAYGSEGLYGAEANGSAALAKGNVNLAFGDSKVTKIEGIASGELMSAEAEAHVKAYTGGEDQKYGIEAGAKAEAQMVKGEFEAKSSNPLYDASAKIGGTAGGVGGGASGTLYVDTNEQLLKIAMT